MRSMVESSKRKSECLEERNASEVFSLPGARDLDETKQFFEHIRALHLARITKRMRTEHLTDDEQARNIATAPPSVHIYGKISAETPNPSNDNVPGNL